VAGGGGELAADQNQHAPVVSLEGLGIQVVVVGDADEAEAGLSRGGDDFLGRAPPVRERGVDVKDAGHTGETVWGRVPHHRPGPPEGHPPEEEAANRESAEAENAPPPPGGAARGR
jgi:hypothetical protein